MIIERRTFADDSIEYRATEGDGPARLRGHGALYGSLSENLGGFREQIEPGAFDDALNDDVRILFNHDPNLILGRTASGTARIGVDKRGLTYEVDIPDTQAGRDLIVSVERGDVNQSSFGFTIARDGEEWDENEDGVVIRTITRIGKLYDQSPVTFPAYRDTDVAKRSFETFLKSRGISQDAIEMALRDKAARDKAFRARLKLFELLHRI